MIVGKRALPSLALTREGGDPAIQLALLARPDDVVLDFDADPERLALARSRGCATIAFATAAGADWELPPPSADPAVRQELAETAYHVLWELVHVFLDHLDGSTAGAGASGFLYPFLGERSADLGPLLADVRRSARAKADESSALRVQTVRESEAVLLAAGRAIRDAADAGGKVLAFGNGGSATDAMDLAADLREPPVPAWAPLPAIDLTEDPAILTALANDVGPEVLFARQLAAHGRPGDVAVAFSTSGGSTNILAALAQARRLRIATIAFVGYGGGRIAGERLADHVVITRSDHIPRIQEAQATAWHVLRELAATDARSVSGSAGGGPASGAR